MNTLDPFLYLDQFDFNQFYIEFVILNQVYLHTLAIFLGKAYKVGLDFVFPWNNNHPNITASHNGKGPS